MQVRAIDNAGNVSPNGDGQVTAGSEEVTAPTLVTEPVARNRRQRARSRKRPQFKFLAGKTPNCTLGFKRQPDMLPATSRFESEVIVHARSQFKCEPEGDQFPIGGRLMACLEIERISRPGWEDIKCRTGFAAAGTDGKFTLAFEFERPCRPGVRNYRLTANAQEVTARRTPIPGRASKSFKGDQREFRCDDAALWRFASKNDTRFGINLEEMRAYRPSDELGRRLTNRGRRRPTSTTNGWAAHHVLFANYKALEGLPESMGFARVCGVDPNEPDNGVWLRGPGLKSTETAYSSLMPGRLNLDPPFCLGVEVE